MSVTANTRRALERAELRTERKQAAAIEQAIARAERWAKSHPPCYYCGHPVAAIVCWPPVCRSCDDLPGWEAL